MTTAKTCSPVSCFAQYETRNYPYKYSGVLHCYSIAGGVPKDENVALGHIKRKISAPDDLIRSEVANMMLECGIDATDAASAVAALKGHIGFRSDPKLGLWIPGAHLKAALKEAANVAAAARKIKRAGWGKDEDGKTATAPNKGILSWLAEHVFVIEDRLYLGVKEPSETVQSFIAKMTPKGPTSAIQYTDVVYDAKVNFTVETDWEFPEEDWAAIWQTGERNGIGSARKMGYGRYAVTQWERLKVA